MRITTRDHLEPLIEPLPPVDGESTGVGRRIDEEDDYAWLDEEMMKVGSLQHASVDWPSAETLAIRLLSEHGKDLRVMGHLLHCLQQSGDAQRFHLALVLLAGVLESWWSDAWPFTGKRGIQARRRLFGQITQRSLKLADNLKFENATRATLQACRQACGAVITAGQASDLPTEGFIELQRVFDKPLSALHDTPDKPRSPQRRTQDKGDDTRDSADERKPSNETLSGCLPELSLERDDPRANRQALLRMADFLNTQSPGDPLGYRLRRHAIWHTIQTLPVTRDDQRTELAPVAGDRAAEYREAVGHDSDPALWQRIEASLAVSPYWLEGHRLSAEAASALGHPNCAEAIREEAARFVDRLTGIDVLTFNDGTRFVDDATRRWLKGSPRDHSANTESGEPWRAGLAEARKRLAEKSLQAALETLDTGLAAAHSPRECAYWRLANAELLDEAGLKSLARQHYQALQQTLADVNLAQWEPDLLAQLDASLNLMKTSKGKGRN